MCRVVGRVVLRVVIGVNGTNGTNGFDTPIVVVAFNRPDLTRAMVDRLRVLRPSRLLLVVDGPRPDRPDDVTARGQVLAELDRIDWPCRIDRDVAVTNLGCDRRITSGLTWAFGLVDRAIVLEDDIAPHPDFYPWVQSMLDRYDDEPDIAMVCGRNELGRWRSGGPDHLLVRHPNIWGWATWASRWNGLDDTVMDRVGPDSGGERLRRVLGDPVVASQYGTFHLLASSGRLTVWDIRWLLTVAWAGRLGVIPPVNLIRYDGYRPDATHTHTAGHVRGQVPIDPVWDGRFRRLDLDERAPIDAAYARACVLLELLSTVIDPRAAARIYRSLRLVRVASERGADVVHHLQPFDHAAESIEVLELLRGAGIDDPWLDQMVEQLQSVRGSSA
jgi:hypothetical protein